MLPDQKTRRKVRTRCCSKGGEHLVCKRDRRESDEIRSGNRQVFQISPASGFSLLGDFITLDTKGNVWSPDREGAFKLDPLTGKYTNYSVRPGKANYDIAADEEEKVGSRSPAETIWKWSTRNGKNRSSWL